MKRKKRDIRYWTKKELGVLLDLWETKSVREIATELGRDQSSIVAKANDIRKVGYNLPKKARAGEARALIMSVLRERKLMK